jgi:hypothetical protein
MSIVALVPFSSTLMAMELWFALWDMSHIVTANELYLVIGIHGVAFVSGVLGLTFCSGFLLGVFDSLVLDWASGVEGHMFCIHVACCSAVTAFVSSMGA